jgi:hypothetical protein
MSLRFGRLAWRFGLGCLLLGEDWASGEPKVCPLLEGGLGRDVDPPGSAALPEAGLGRGVIESLEWTDR